MRNRRKKADWRAIKNLFSFLHRVRERLFFRIGKAVLFLGGVVAYLEKIKVLPLYLAKPFVLC